MDNSPLFYINDLGENVPVGEFNLKGFGMTPIEHDTFIEMSEQEHDLRFGKWKGIKERRLYVSQHGQTFLVWPNGYLLDRDLSSPEILLEEAYASLQYAYDLIKFESNFIKL